MKAPGRTVLSSAQGHLLATVASGLRDVLACSNDERGRSARGCRPKAGVVVLAAAASALASLAGIGPARADQRENFEAIAIADRMQILEEIARYSWAIDSGDMPEYLDRFWEDGYILHPKPDGSPGKFEGHAEIEGWLGNGFRNRATQTYGHQHQFSAVVMQKVDEVTVDLQAYINIFRHEFDRQYWPSGPSWRMGTWHARYEKRDSSWKIRSLDVRMWTDTALGAGTGLPDRTGRPGSR